MALFVVSYDLNRTKDYQKLWDELRRLEAQKVLLSVYLVELNYTVKGVLDHLTQHLDDDDSMMVIEFSKMPRHKKARAGTNAWINAHFP